MSQTRLIYCMALYGIFCPATSRSARCRTTHTERNRQKANPSYLRHGPPTADSALATSAEGFSDCPYSSADRGPETTREIHRCRDGRNRARSGGVRGRLEFLDVRGPRRRLRPDRGRVPLVRSISRRAVSEPPSRPGRRSSSNAAPLRDVISNRPRPGDRPRRSRSGTRNRARSSRDRGLLLG